MHEKLFELLCMGINFAKYIISQTVTIHLNFLHITK